MTIWIGTNQCGWDNQTIGFHSISGCTGIVVCTDQWVAGWHVGGGAGVQLTGTNQSKAQFLGSAFVDYMRQQINPNPWPAHGVPNSVKLYSVHVNQPGWQPAIADFAALIGYQGPVRGLELRGKVGTDSVDVVITRIGDACHFEYKRTSKMTHVKLDDDELAGHVVKTVRGGAIDPVRTQDIVNRESRSATVIRTRSNKGQMHRAANTMFASFDA